MDALTALIARIGIFMIAAQAVIHFAPAEKYAKYIKLIAGIMILVQFLGPVYKLMGGMEDELSSAFTDAYEKTDGGLFGEDDNYNAAALNKSIINNIEEEIKSRLNNDISDEGYYVIKAEIELDGYGSGNLKTEYGSYNGQNNSSYEKYRLNKIKVTVKSAAGRESAESYNESSVADSDGGSAESSSAGSDGDGNGIFVKTDKISVDRIDIDGSGDKEKETGPVGDDAEAPDDEQALKDMLRERFCAVLRVDEECMEVSIYG